MLDHAPIPPDFPEQTPALEWLHVMPPADTAEMVLGYEAAYPFLQLAPAPVEPAGGPHRKG